MLWDFAADWHLVYYYSYASSPPPLRAVIRSWHHIVGRMLMMMWAAAETCTINRLNPFSSPLSTFILVTFSASRTHVLNSAKLTTCQLLQLHVRKHQSSSIRILQEPVLLFEEYTRQWLGTHGEGMTADDQVSQNLKVGRALSKNHNWTEGSDERVALKWVSCKINAFFYIFTFSRFCTVVSCLAVNLDR